MIFLNCAKKNLSPPPPTPYHHPDRVFPYTCPTRPLSRGVSLFSIHQPQAPFFISAWWNCFWSQFAGYEAKLTTIDRTDHTDKIHTYLFCFETSLILKDSARHTNMAMIVAHMIVEFKRGSLADEWKSNSWGSFGLSVAEFVGGGSVYTNLVSWFCWTQLLILASNFAMQQQAQHRGDQPLMQTRPSTNFLSASM